MSALPDGTVTLLFADVEGSTRHLLRLGERYSVALERQSVVVSNAVERFRGHVIDAQGDSSFAAFVTAQDAILAAIDAQRELATEPWPDGEPFRVRFGVHTGEPVRNAAGYAGLDVHRAARICTAAHGGQILISQTTRDLIAHAIPDGTVLLDLGHHLLKDLPYPEHLIQVAGPGLVRDFPPPRTLGTPAGLPPHRQPLIGRESQIDDCRGLFQRDDIRILSLTGPGGSGKTSLAVHLAGSLVLSFDDGVYYVALAPIADAALVPRAISRALGIQEIGSRPLLEVLTGAIGSRQCLLVLDNFEHVLPASSFLADLIQACPRLKILVTSREVLRLSCEYYVPVPPLDLPPSDATTAAQLADNDSVRLFVARAQAVRPGFALTDQTAPIIGEICRRLDGLPLALELAAARSRLLPPRALLARLDRRLPILSDGPRDLPARQRTLRDTISWSYGLLNEDEKRVFRLLGAFVGGCTLDAVEAVCDDPDRRMQVLDLLASLVDKSLVRQSLADGEARFSQLETIREFAIDLLEDAGEAGGVRRRHADCFLQLVEAVDPLLIGPEQVTWLDRLEVEHGNLQAALAWAREAHMTGQETDRGVPGTMVGLQMAGALHWFWWLGGHVAEGRRWLVEVLAWEPDGDARAAQSRALFAAGTLAMIQGAYEDAHQLLDEASRVAESLGDIVTSARCRTYRGIVQTYFSEDGDFDIAEALQTAEHASAMFEGTDDTWGQALAASQLGAHARRAGEYERAGPVLERAVSLARTTGERYLLGSCLPKLGNVYMDQAAYARAEPLYKEALSAFREIREVWWTGRCLQYLARTAHGLGNSRLAALLTGGADQVLESGGARRIPRERHHYEALVIDLRQSLGEDVYQHAYERGLQMPLDSLLELALETPSSAAIR